MISSYAIIIIFTTNLILVQESSSLSIKAAYYEAKSKLQQQQRSPVKNFLKHHFRAVGEFNGQPIYPRTYGDGETLFWDESGRFNQREFPRYRFLQLINSMPTHDNHEERQQTDETLTTANTTIIDGRIPSTSVGEGEVLAYDESLSFTQG